MKSATRLVSKPNHIPLGSERSALEDGDERGEYNEGCGDYVYKDGSCGRVGPFEPADAPASVGVQGADAPYTARVREGPSTRVSLQMSGFCAGQSSGCVFSECLRHKRLQKRTGRGVLDVVSMICGAV